MNQQRRTQIISGILTLSLLLSFWICVEGCETIETDCEAQITASAGLHVENAGEDSCSIQTAPSVVFSNQKLFVPTDFSSIPRQFRQANIKTAIAPVLAYGSEKMFVRLPLQILRQLRI